jgi:hypothetical protein
MLDRLVAPARSLEKDAQVLSHLRLAHVLRQESGAERQVELLVV